MDRITLRPAQLRMREAALAKLQGGGRTVVAHLSPATGKTTGALDVAQALFRADVIDTVMYYSPRLNLCRQVELGWEVQRRLYEGRVLGPIAWRDNTPPLLRGGAGGYASTYASLVAAAGLHLAVARSRRPLLVLDEAQVLGTDGLGGGTRSAEIVEALAGEAAAVLLMSGTPYRSDGLPLLLAEYTDPDPQGRRYLRADVTASYTEGVAQGYLRPIEFLLVDGVADTRTVDADGEEGGAARRVVSEARGGLGPILEHQGYWTRLVDRAVEQVGRVQQLDPRLCGLVAACSQAHALRIQGYLRSRYPDLRVLLAISDDAGAQTNLEAFRRGGVDLLLTVRMAYIGYDHPPISVVCALGDYRARGFLHQLVARGLRVMQGLPVAVQTCYAVVPDDPLMASFAVAMRREAEEGLLLRKPSPGPASGPATAGVAVVVAAAATGERAQGPLAAGDLTALELGAVARLQKRYGIDSPATTLAAMLRAGGVDIAALAGAPRPRTDPGTPGPGSSGAPDPGTAARPEPGPLLTARERELAVRRELQAVLISCDAEIRRVDPGWPMGGSAAECVRSHGGVPGSACDARELMARLRWAREVWRPGLRTGAGPGAASGR